MSRTIVLVSCVKTKQTDGQAHAAADLYTSPWFKSARQFAEREGAAWFILSAEHGVLHPTNTIPAYEKTLSKMKKAERQAWSVMVLEQLRHVLQPGDKIIVLAGVAYRAFLVDELGARGHLVDIPMAGLELGEQKAWLNAANAAAATPAETAPPIIENPSPHFAEPTPLFSNGESNGETIPPFSPIAFVEFQKEGEEEAAESRICPVEYSDTTVSVRITINCTVRFARPGAGRDFGIYRRAWIAPSSKTRMQVYVPVLSPAPVGAA